MTHCFHGEALFFFLSFFFPRHHVTRCGDMKQLAENDSGTVATQAHVVSLCGSTVAPLSHTRQDVPPNLRPSLI